MYKKNIFSLFFLFSISIILAFLYGFSSYHFKFFPYNNIKNIVKGKSNYIIDYSKIASLNIEWAKKITKGGYILHIRHGMREKWTDAIAFDAIELLGNLDGRNSSFYRAVCLTEKGIEESKLVNSVFNTIGIKVSYVLSSPSCRARETAIYGFKRIDQIEPSVLHRTAQISVQHKEMGTKLRSVVDAIEFKKGENIVVSGHAGTLSIDFNNGVGIVDENKTMFKDIDDRSETGILVIERINGKYFVRHKFNSISDLANSIIKLPINDSSGGKFLFEGGDYSPTNIKSGFVFNPQDTG